jgi:murein DD-endopeptidase MepM/ murein hydrolase activator NlpD
MWIRSVVRCVVLVAVIAAAVPAISAPASAEIRPTAREGAGHAVPLFGTTVRMWNAPEDQPFAAGHRGIDVAAPEGTPVRASGAGVVSFTGNVAGNRTVTVDHPDGVRTSYSFLGTIVAHRNDVVALGDVVGTVGAGHPNEGLPPHVHLSARRGETYFDPVQLYVGTSCADLVELVA